MGKCPFSLQGGLQGYFGQECWHYEDMAVSVLEGEGRSCERSLSNDEEVMQDISEDLSGDREIFKG